jgi:putative peptidoglycan lipid II flippase
MLSTLFQHGRLFDGHSVIMAQKSLAMFAIGITPFMLIKILVSGFYARQNLRTPVRIGVIAMIANIAFNCLLIFPLQHAGIALATSLASIVNMSFLYYFLRKEKIYVPREGWGFFIFRITFANVLLAVWLWQGAGDLQWWITNQWQARAMHLLILLSSAVAVYFAGLWLAGLRPRDLLIPQRPVASLSD